MYDAFSNELNNFFYHVSKDVKNVPDLEKMMNFIYAFPYEVTIYAKDLGLSVKDCIQIHQRLGNKTPLDIFLVCITRLNFLEFDQEKINELYNVLIDKVERVSSGEILTFGYFNWKVENSPCHIIYDFLSLKKQLCLA